MPKKETATKEALREDECPTTESEKRQKEFDLSRGSDLVDLIRNVDDESQTKTEFSKHILKLQKENKLSHYELILIYDETSSITSYHSNRIYEAASRNNCKKDILLLLHSSGGRIEPGYLISKTCKRLAKSKFVVAVPRRAKSAATLISLGADEIHMGLMSELGPIDPQFGGYPALVLSGALQTLADLACRFPGSSEMLSKYLTQNLSLRDLGYFERINESAAQYAERLLTNRELPTPYTATSLADHFVNHYKDHGFVIDADEASSLLGPKIVKQATNEYNFANQIYNFFDLASVLFSWIKKKDLCYVGGVSDGLWLKQQKEE